MSGHIVRHIPQNHPLYPKKVKVAEKRIPFISMPVLKETIHQKEKKYFQRVEGKTWRWGMFDCPVYRSLQTIADGKNVIPQGQEFIVAWPGKMDGNEDFSSLGFLKGVFGSDKFTHYNVIVRSDKGHPSYSSQYIKRGLIEGKLP